MSYSGERIYRILLCGDDFGILESNQAYIEQFSKELGIRISMLTNTLVGAEVYGLLEKIDLVILDIDLPGEGGMEFARYLYQKNNNIPVIMITGSTQYREEASMIYSVGLLSKPVEVDKFRMLFQRALGQVVYSERKYRVPYLELEVNKKRLCLRQDKIICLEKIQKKVKIKSDMGVYEVRDTLLHMEQKLLPCFLRISQSVIVNMGDILCMEGSDVFLSSKDTYRIGRTYQKQVERRYREFWR